MTSNMLAGERRWVSARRGGMTVLGKVAVPKPLNLPSQRLENHGLDPNVEIVPKGTLSWGSRTSSSTSNPWGSSTHSPNADGGSSSPSHLRSRPSSGSGTRPSTAGSDRTQEPTTSAWGTSSRPSSASGPLSSNKVPSTLARPHSAETRPGSSQLSRFAEPVSEHPVAWGATTTAERLGVLSTKNEGFSLASGDFPTLGSDKDASGKTTESQDHGSCSRPSSASGKVAQPLEKTIASHSDMKGGSFDAWKRDGRSAEDPPQHGMEKWQGDPHQYHSPNVPPQHFDAWRGPPMNSPAALWYRGPPGGPPYGAPVPPGGFPIEPFPYFPPQMPPPAIANSQPGPPPGPGSRGHHPRGGDMYRPQIADAYIRPNMPFRPGFYSGPVAYEGYFGPPMGYCNSNEREIPLMGMPPGPPVYNRYSGPTTPDPSNSHARIGSHGSNTKAMQEALESSRPDDAKGPFKVLLKHDARDERETWEHAAPTNGPYHDRSSQRSLQKHEWGGEHGSEKESQSRRTTGSGNCYPRSYGDRGVDSSDTTNANSLESVNTMKVADGSWAKKSGYVESSGGVPPSSLAPEKVSAPAVTAKDSSLMQKIEGLNAKARASDGRFEAPYVSSEEDMNKSELNSKVTNSVNEARGGLMSSERTHTSVTTGNKGGHSIAAMSRRPYHGAQTRNDHPGKPKIDSHDDGWRKKPVAAVSSAVASGTCLEPASNVHACESGPQVEAVEQALTDISVSVEKESLSELHDSADTQAQRTKMKELARQRALQLQKEEEERIKQQKTKALAKLEELNRRMQAGDASCQKTEKDSPADVIKQDLQGSSAPETVVSTVKPQARNATLAAHGDVIDASGRMLNKDSQYINPPVVLEFGTSIMVQSEIAIPQPQAFLSKQDANRVSASHGKETCQSSDGGLIRHKRTSFKQRPNMTPKNINEKSVPVCITEVSKGPTDVIINKVQSTEAHEVGLNAELNMVNNAKVAVDSSVQPRRKGNRTNKNKQKLDAVLPRPASPSPVPNDSNPVKVRTQQEKLNSSQLVLDVSSNQAASGDNVVQPSDQSPPLPTEEGHGRVVNQWKPQHPRRTQRNQHSNIHTDKFQGVDTVVWAPVRSQSKTEDVAEASQKTGSNSIGPLKSDNVVQSNSKSKRAEMERYVPKPVAKELAQHGSSQQPLLLSGNSPGPDGTTGRAESRPENAGCSVPTGSATESFSTESREGDGKHNNKQGKAHGVWRQRGSTELALDTSKNDCKSLDQTESLKPDGDSLRYESKCSSEFDVSDGWNMPDDFDGQRTTIPVVPDEGNRGKGKRYPSKGQRSTGNFGYEYKNNSVGPQQNHTLSGATEINQMDRRVAAKESRGMGNRTPPHWQPKSHMLAVNNQHEGVSTGSQHITMEGDRGNKRDYHHDKVSIPLRSEKESRDMGAGQADSFSSEDKIVSEVPNIRNADPRRERKPALFRGRPYSPNQGPVVKTESAPAESAEAVQERSNSGLRRNVNQNNRSGRTQESHENLFSVKDNRQHNTSSGRERQRNNMHYEYQPVGQYNNSKPSNFEEAADGSHSVDQKRYRERGQVQSRRGGGNFHGRQGGSGRANANYD